MINSFNSQHIFNCILCYFWFIFLTFPHLSICDLYLFMIFNFSFSILLFQLFLGLYWLFVAILGYLFLSHYLLEFTFLHLLLQCNIGRWVCLDWFEAFFLEEFSNNLRSTSCIQLHSFNFHIKNGLFYYFYALCLCFLVHRTLSMQFM